MKRVERKRGVKRKRGWRGRGGGEEEEGWRGRGWRRRGGGEEEGVETKGGVERKGGGETSQALIVHCNKLIVASISLKLSCLLN